jgi:hypothetical protein
LVLGAVGQPFFVAFEEFVEVGDFQVLEQEAGDLGSTAQLVVAEAQLGCLLDLGVNCSFHVVCAAHRSTQKYYYGCQKFPTDNA